MPNSDTRPPHDSEVRLGFLLIDQFGLLSYASLLEPFRAANALSGRALFSWRTFSTAGAAVRSAAGGELVVDASLPDSGRVDILFVCAAGNAISFRDEATFGWLRGKAASGARIAGVSGGPFLLARAGLLRGRRCTVHWEHLPAFREEFPLMQIEDRLFVIDGPLMTCAGASAGLDLALQIIRQDQGEALALRVGDWFIRTHVRAGDGAQRLSVRERYGLSSPGLIRALTHMEAHLAPPLSRTELARRSGLSLRQLDRQFAAQIGGSITDHYLRLRLERAMSLLKETALSCTEVSLASGFASFSHFSRRFKQHYAISPGQARRVLAAPLGGISDNPPEGHQAVKH